MSVGRVRSRLTVFQQLYCYVSRDSVAALKMIAEVDIRSECYICRAVRRFLQGSLSSPDHVSVWHAIISVCIRAGVQPRASTAAKM